MRLKERLFKIILAKSIEDLEYLVNDEMQKNTGWAPTGSIYVERHLGVRYYQAMTKHKRNVKQGTQAWQKERDAKVKKAIELKKKAREELLK